MIIADILVDIANKLSSKLKAINNSLKNKGQTEATSFDDVPAKIDAISLDIKLQEKTTSPSTSKTTVTPDIEYDGLSRVVVDAIQTQTKTATPSTSSQSIKPDSGKFLSEVTVKAVSTQEKSVSPSTSVKTITPDTGKFLSKVMVSAIPTTTLATPNISVSNSGLITATVTQNSEGYVNAGSTQAQKQLSTVGNSTFSPTEDYQYILSHGTYLTGDIILAGDSNFKEENIKSGVTMWGKTGTYKGEGSECTLIQCFDGVETRLFSDNSTSYLYIEGIDASITSPEFYIIGDNYSTGGCAFEGIFQVHSFYYSSTSDSDRALVLSYGVENGICVAYGGKEYLNDGFSYSFSAGEYAMITMPVNALCFSGTYTVFVKQAK